MIKKYIRLITLGLMMVSCQTTQNRLKVYEHNPIADGDDIFGNPKDSFFGEKTENITIIDNFNKQEIVNYIEELNKIKELLIKSPNSYNSKTLKAFDGLDILDSYYSNAFVYKQDTIYSDPSISCWLYKDKAGKLKTICYESEILKSKFNR